MTGFNAGTGPPPAVPVTRRVRRNHNRDRELAVRQAELDIRLEQIVREAIRQFKSRC